MEEDVLNRSLSKIANSLKEVDSARIQVEKVTQGGASLTAATHNLATEVKQLAEDIKSETTKVIEGFAERLEGLEKSIDLVTVKSHKTISEEIEKFADSTKNLQEKYSATLIKINSSQAESLNGLGSAFEKSSGQMLSEAKETVLEVKTLAIDTIKEEKDEISKTIKAINQYSSEIGKLLNQIAGMKLPGRLDNLSRQIEKSVKQQKIFSYITWSILVLGFVATLFFN